MIQTDTLFYDAVEAVINGEADRLRNILAKRPDMIAMRSPDEYGATLLHYIAANGVQDEFQKTAPNVVEITKILLAAGAQVDALANTYGGGRAQTPLALLVSSIHPANARAQGELVVTLAQAGALVNGLDDDGLPLATAIAFRQPQAVAALMRCGARVDNIVFAAALGMVALLQQLIAEAEANAGTSNYISTERNNANVWLGTALRPTRSLQDALEQALVYAGTFGQVSVIEYLLDYGVDPNAASRYNQTALHEAAYMGHMDAVQLLISRGADPNIRETQFASLPAGWAAEGGHHEIEIYLLQVTDPHVLNIVDAAYVGNLARVRELLDEDPDNVHLYEPGLALRAAVAHGHPEIVRLLLLRGSEVNYIGSRGMTPLDMAQHYDHEAIAALLREYGAKTAEELRE